MGLFDAIGIAGTGLTARAHPHGRDRGEPRQRRHHARRQRPALPAPGGRARAGRARAASAARSRARSAQSGAAQPAGGVAVTGIVSDATPDQQVYDPGNPEANAQGYVKMPNVSTVTEMTDLISESAVLPVRRHGDADRQVDVHRDAGAAQMIVPVGGVGAGFSREGVEGLGAQQAASPGEAPAAGGPEALEGRAPPAPSKARAAKARAPRKRSRPSKAAARQAGLGVRRRRIGELRERPHGSDLLAREDAAERQGRLAGARHRHRQRPGERGRDGRGRAAGDAARLADPHQGHRSGPDDLPDAGLIGARLPAHASQAHPPRMADRRAAPRSRAILFIYMFLHTVSRPSYTTLVSGVDPSQTGKMTSTLSQQGISYQLQNNGTAIAVQSNETSQARVALAGAEPARQHPARLLAVRQTEPRAKATSSSRSPTSARSRASSHETIDSVQGVSGAQVELVLPNAQNQLFGENQNASSAAVLLSGTTLARSELSARDRAARRLERPGAAAQQSDDHRRHRPAAVAGSLQGRRAARARASRKPSNATTRARRPRSTRCSRRRSGPARRRCMVYANLNVNQTTQESLTYGKAVTPLQQSKTSKRSAGNGSAGAGGTTGTANLQRGCGRKRRQVQLQARKHQLPRSA